MHVYKEFCSKTGLTPTAHSTFGPSSVGAASQLGTETVRSSVIGSRPRLCYNFGKCTGRKDISEGQYSAHEMRFEGPPPKLPETSRRHEIGKYAGRDSKSSAGDNFSAPLTGLFYDYQDNYDALLDRSGMRTCHSFKTEKIWQNKEVKHQYAKYKLTKQQVSSINFSNLDKKLKSVKPKKGKALRR